MKHFHACCPSHATSLVANRIFRSLTLDWRIFRISLQYSRYAFHSSRIVTYAQVQRWRHFRTGVFYLVIISTCLPGEDALVLAKPEFEGLWDQHRPYTVPKHTDQTTRRPGNSKMEQVLRISFIFLYIYNHPPWFQSSFCYLERFARGGSFLKFGYFFKTTLDKFKTFYKVK